MPVLAVDMGGTFIKLGIVNGGALIGYAQLSAQASSSTAENLERASEALNSLMQKHSIKQSDLEGFGLALPSIIDSKNQKVISRYVKYNDASSFDFTGWAKEKWNLPIILENDARAALVGEWQYGAGKGCDDLVMITLGTGLGSAVLLNGKLLRGRNFIAGNLWGHISVNLHGQPCNCGYIGCLETEASAWVLKQKFEDIDGYEQSSLSNKDISFLNVFSEAQKGDEAAKALVEHCIHAWSICAVNLVHAYDPQRIIFSGGIIEQAALILPAVQSAIDNYAWLPAGNVQAVKAEQTVYGSLLGLGYLLQQNKQ